MIRALYILDVFRYMATKRQLSNNAATAPAQGVGTAVQGGNTPPTVKTAHTAQEGGAGGD